MDTFWTNSVNHAAVKKLIASLSSPLEVVPFIGAGLSMPYRFPGWSDFLQSLADEAGLTEAVAARLTAGQYIEAATDLHASLGAFHFRNAIETTFGSKPDVNAITAAAFLPLLATGPVITTNFDHVLETIFARHGRPFDAIVLGGSTDRIRQAVGDNAHYLLKVHGDAFEQTTRVLTTDEYSTHYGEFSPTSPPALPLPNLLFRIMTSRHLLFLGSSMNRDRTLEVLRVAASVNGALDHFAVLPLPATAADMREQRKHLGDNYHVWPIWITDPYEGGFELLPEFIQFLVEESGVAGASTTDLIRAVNSSNWLLAQQLVSSGSLVPLRPKAKVAIAIASGKQHVLADEADLAYAAFSDAIHEEPGNAEALLLRSVVQLMRDRTESALSDADRAIEAGGQPAQALTIAGLVLFDRGDAVAARERFESALRISPGDPLALNLLLMLLAIDGDFGSVDKLCIDNDPVTLRADVKDLVEACRKHLREDAPGSWWKRPAARFIAGLGVGMFKLIKRDMVRELIFSELTGISVPSRFDLPAPIDVKSLPPSKES